ncbi:hypothetical protein NC651_012617 [Populus alba x Populus x berolinensis]|nr:hypothetical protein NC651_012617 [Populus alba x Populus x berolinensis]
MAGRCSSDNDECFDFEEYDDGESFDRMVEGIRERTSDENERTSLLTSKILEDFIKKDFEAMDIRKAGKEVVLVDLDLGVDVHQRTMNLRLWEMNNSFSYMLTSSWNDVLSRNEGRLNANDICKLIYSFNHDN